MCTANVNITPVHILENLISKHVILKNYLKGISPTPLAIACMLLMLAMLSTAFLNNAI